MIEDLEIPELLAPRTGRGETVTGLGGGLRKGMF